MLSQRSHWSQGQPHRLHTLAVTRLRDVRGFADRRENMTQREETTVRLVRFWQTISLLARQGTALSVFTLVLLPAVWTAADFHTCALHRVPPQSRLPQLSDLSAENKCDHVPCLARSWHSAADTAGLGGPLCITLLHSSSLTGEHLAAARPQVLTTHGGRAPPRPFSSLVVRLR